MASLLYIPAVVFRAIHHFRNGIEFYLVAGAGGEDFKQFLWLGRGREPCA